jgi:hypothetical protein
MTPNFPVAGLMLAAACAADAGVAAGGVDILSGTLLWCDFPLGGNLSIAYGEWWLQTVRY